MSSSNYNTGKTTKQSLFRQEWSSSKMSFKEGMKSNAQILSCKCKMFNAETQKVA